MEMGESAATGPGEADLDRLDAALRDLRRSVSRFLESAVFVPGLGRPVDVAQLAACAAVGEQSAEHPDEPVTVKDVAGALHLEHSTTSRLLSDAESEGLVVRATDSTDRRRRAVHLTPTGEVAVEHALAERRALLGHAMADWTPAEVASLAGMLERLSRGFGTAGRLAGSATRPGPD